MKPLRPSSAAFDFISSSERAATAMSIIGFASIPRTAVLPTCSAPAADAFHSARGLRLPRLFVRRERDAASF